MRIAIAVFAAACLLAPAETLAAQDTTFCRFDTLGHTFRDTVDIGMAAGRAPHQSAAARADYLLTAQAIQTYFHPPDVVHLPLWARTATSKGSLVAKFPPPDSLHLFFPAPYGLHGYILLRLDKTGRLADSAVAVDIASPDMRDAVIAAVRRADSAIAFSPPSDDVRHDGGKIRLQFVQLPYRQGTSVPLMRVVVPGIQVEASPKVASFPQLKYPASLRDANLGDHVVVQFVVDADGRVVPGTMDLLEAEYRDFAEEAVRAAEDARFEPAHVGTCALPTIVRMPINFAVPSPVGRTAVRVDTQMIRLDSRHDDVLLESAVTQRPSVISGPPLQYPDMMRRAGIEGRVLIQAIVDTSGRAELESIRILTTPNPQFNDAARDYVVHALFRPARLHRRAVRVLINMPIDFKIQHAVGAYRVPGPP
jgi:TonB family protein